MKKFLAILVLMLVATTAVFAFTPSEIKEPAQPTKPASGASSETSSCHIGYGQSGSWKEKDITFYKPSDGRIYLKTANEIYNSALSSTSRNKAYNNTETIVFAYATPDSFDEGAPDKNGPFLIGYADTANAYCPIIFHDGTLYFLVADSNQTLVFNENSSSFLSNFSELTTVSNAGNVDTSLVKNLNGFASETKINNNSVSAIAGIFSSAPLLESVSGMFKGLTTISSANLSSMDLSHVYDASEMFSGCSKLTSVTLPADSKALHSACTEVQDQERASATTSQMASQADMIRIVSLVRKTVDGYELVGSSYVPKTFEYYTYNESAAQKAGVGFSMARMFNGCSLLAEVDLSGVQMNSYTDLSKAFYNCSTLGCVYVDSNFNDASTPVAFPVSNRGTIKYYLKYGSYNYYYETSKDSYYLTYDVFNGCNNLKGYIPSPSGTTTTTVPFSGVGVEFAKTAFNGGYFTVKDSMLSYSYGLSFDGTINGYYEVSSVKFTPQNVVITYPDYTDDNAPNLSETISYASGSKFRASFAASQMTRDFVIKVDNMAPQTHSIAEIAGTYIRNSKTNGKANEGNLCKALLQYGHYAQVYFEEGGTLADDAQFIDAADRLTLDSPEFDDELLTAPVYKKNGTLLNSSNVQSQTAASDFNAMFLGNSVVCYSEICVRHSFAFPAGIGWDAFDVTVTLSDGTVLTELKRNASGAVIQDGRYELISMDSDQDGIADRYSIEIKGFAAPRISDSYTVSITNKAAGGATFTIQYSPMSYLFGAINSSNTTKAPLALKNLCKSIYWYWWYADVYFNDKEN